MTTTLELHAKSAYDWNPALEKRGQFGVFSSNLYHSALNPNKTPAMGCLI
jgi:hypothetical protein